MINSLHDVPNFGDDPGPAGDLLSEVASPSRDDGDIVDFTFRIPQSVLDEAKALARELGCSTNAAFAGLVDIGLRSRGRPGINTLAPNYIGYLRRGRRQESR